MIEEAFVNGDSIIHRLDPRVKTVIAFLFSIVVATSDRFVALIPSIFLSVSSIYLARLPLKNAHIANGSPRRAFDTAAPSNLRY